MLAEGQSVGRYVIESVLGEGGMGTVYRARDVMLRRSVALKVVVPKDAEAIARFLREARAAAALQHPNIVSVYDVGEDEGRVYLAMELVAGKALREVIADPSIAFAKRLAWLVDIAKALAAAHERGFIHRDVKPDNVLLAPNGTAKLLDFGIVKERDPGPSSFRTKTGDLFGTPDYMAPEQWASSDVDARADQYAWGVMAYEVLSRQALPQRERRPPLQSVAHEVPDAVAACIAKAFAQARDDRHADMNAIVAVLDPFCAKASVDTTAEATRPPIAPVDLPRRTGRKPKPVTKKTRSRAGVFMIALAATLVAVGIVVVLLLARPSLTSRQEAGPSTTTVATGEEDAPVVAPSSSRGEGDASSPLLHASASSRATSSVTPPAASSVAVRATVIHGVPDVDVLMGEMTCETPERGVVGDPALRQLFDPKRPALTDCMRLRFGTAINVHTAIELSFAIHADGSLGNVTADPHDVMADCAIKVVRDVKLRLPPGCTSARAAATIKPRCTCSHASVSIDPRARGVCTEVTCR